MATSPQVLASLNEDLAREHGAIMQYVVHAVQLRDTALNDQVKRMAREEMWHFEWLAEAIRDHGGRPALERAPLFVAASLAQSLRADVATEAEALSHYESTLQVLGDSDLELRALIERIMDDERHHATHFERLAEQVEEGGEDAFAATALIQPPDLAVVGPAVLSEYAGVLQYLWNKYGCGDCEVEEDYFELAVEEMRHAGWAVSYVAGTGVPHVVDVPTERVAWVGSSAEAMERARKVEAVAETFYDSKAPAAANPELRADLDRAAGQHRFHRHILDRMSR